MIDRFLHRVINGPRSYPARLDGEFGGTFDRHRAIFIHIPKAAGTSIAVALFGHQISHSSIVDYYRRDYDKASKYFKFAFVREPFSRLVSAYRFLNSGGMNQWDLDFARQHIHGHSFADIVERLANDPLFLDTQHFRPQYKFVTHPEDPRTVLVNFIGRVERLEHDIRPVLARLGVDTKIPIRNQSTDSNPIDEADLGRLRDAVLGIYQHDYEIFAYERPSRLLGNI
jgi:hypothetical protein